MPKFFSNSENGPAELTGLSAGSWTTDIDLDLDASFVGDAPTIPATATGVILRFSETGGSYNIGARHPDGATSILEKIANTTDGNQVSCYVGINSAHEVDLFVQNTSVKVYLIGYFEAETTFFSDGNQHTFTAPSSNVWVSVDLSSYLSSGAVFAILQVTRSTTDRYYSFRHPDSSDDRTAQSNRNIQWVIVPVDSSRNIELYSQSTVTSLILVGEITTNAESRTSGGDVSLSTTGSYQTVDFSSLSPPANAVLAIVEIRSTAIRRWAARSYGDTSYADLYGDMEDNTTDWAIFPVIDADGSENERCQAKIEDTSVDFYVWGWITEASGATAALTGTAISDGVLESEIVTGGETIIITLTGDTWVAAGATFDAQRQNIIDGMDSAQVEAAGWDAVVKAGLGVSAVVRTSDTVVTITL